MRRKALNAAVLLYIVVAVGLVFLSYLDKLGMLPVYLLFLMVLALSTVALKPTWFKLQLTKLIGFKTISGKRHATESVNSKPRVLLMSSNGAGLGHLTRLLAIAKELQNVEYHIYTLSKGIDKIAVDRNKVTYFPSYGTLEMDSATWNPLFSMNFESFIATFKPEKVVFDGTFVYTPVTEVCRKYDVELIWLQRGCWKDEVDQKSVQRHNAHLFVDRVVIPGDFAVEEDVDLGGVIVAENVAPIINFPDKMGDTQTELLEELGLTSDQSYVLIQLGGGVINDNSGTLKSILENLPEAFVPVMTKNPLSNNRDYDPRIELITAYPISRYFPLFEFGIFAAGYNSVQEAVAMKLPAIFVPNLETGTDDQVFRAEQMEIKGLGFIARSAEEMARKIKVLSSPEVRRDMRAKLSEQNSSNGSKQFADLLFKTDH